MSIKVSRINEISQRIIVLSSSYASNKEFLDICEINNHSLITDLKSGRIKVPGAAIIAQIVRGTGCCGTWLLTGEGEMYPPRENPALVAGGGEQYMSRMLQLQRLIENLEQRKADWKNMKLPPGLALQSARLTASILELQQAAENDSGS